MVLGAYDYEAQNADELSFSECQLMKLVRKRMDGWWLVELDGKFGKVSEFSLKFPSLYTVKINASRQFDMSRD